MGCERTTVVARFGDLLPIKAEISKSCRKKRKSYKFKVTSVKVVRVRGWDQTSESPHGIRRQRLENITKHLSRKAFKGKFSHPTDCQSHSGAACRGRPLFVSQINTLEFQGNGKEFRQRMPQLPVVRHTSEEETQ